MPDLIYQKMRASMRETAGLDVSKEALLWTVADAAAGIADGIKDMAFCGVGSTALQTVRFLISTRASQMIPNPMFVAYGHEHESNTTRNYFLQRNLLNFGSAGLNIGGGLGASVTVVNVAGVVQASNSLVTTSLHVQHLQRIASKHKNSQTISTWLKLLLNMKRAKADMRGVQLVGSLACAAGVGAIVAGVLSTALKMGISARFSHVVFMLSMELHWRAFQEQTIGGSSYSGPATDIIKEIFTRRGMTRVFGQHKSIELINDPAGWMAISDKIMQM